MSSLGTPTPAAEERDSSRVIIFVAVGGVIAIMVALAFLLREPPKAPKTVPAYAASLKIGDLKLSAAENFIGATVSYVDGSVKNSGDKTVTHAVVAITFKDDMGQVVQPEEMPLLVLKSGGPYPDFVDLSVSPLGPGQMTQFRLTFDRISAQWNHAYPEIRVTDVAVK